LLFSCRNEARESNRETDKVTVCHIERENDCKGKERTMNGEKQFGSFNVTFIFYLFLSFAIIKWDNILQSAFNSLNKARSRPSVPLQGKP
jgi:hypothetical protein